MEKQELDKALSKAKIGLMTKDQSVFWSTVCMGLKHEFDDSIPTACTNGVYIKYSPEFFINGCRDNEERTGLVFHETGHVVLQHIPRRGERDPMIYNMAGDHVINIMGHEAGFKFPQGALMDFKYKDWSTGQVYEDLIQQQENMPMPNVMLDLVYDGEAEDPETQRELDDLLVQATMAADAADQAGSVPGDVRRYVEELLNPKIPWDAIFRKFMTKFDQTRFNYKRPNRRFFPHVFVPKRHNRKLTKVAFAIDASASVTDREFANYVSGISTVMKKYNPDEIILLQFTTRITGIETIKSMKTLKNVDFIGRGGTSVHPVMQWAEEEKPDLLVVFSDGQFNTPYHKPPNPLVWIIHNNPEFKMPFGKVIHFDIE